MRRGRALRVLIRVGGDLPVLQRQDACVLAERLDIPRRDDDELICRSFTEKREHGLRALRAETVRRLVQKQHAAFAGKRAGERPETPLLSGEAVRVYARRAFEPEQSERFARIFPRVPAGEAREHRGALRVFRKREIGKEKRFVRGGAFPQPGAAPRFAPVRRILAADEDFAAGRRLTQGEQMQQRRFPAAGRAGEHHEAGLRQRDIQAAQRMHALFSGGGFQRGVFQLDHRKAHPFPFIQSNYTFCIKRGQVSGAIRQSCACNSLFRAV